MSDIFTGIVFGLVMAFCFGTADFLSKKAISQLKPFKALLLYQLVGTLFFLAFALLFMRIPLISIETLELAAVIALFNVVGFLFYFKGLEIGLVSVNVTVASMWGAVTGVLAILFLGEALSAMQLLSLLIITAGAVLVSVELKDLKSLKRVREHVAEGVFYSLAAAFLIGAAFFLADYAVAILGGMFTLLLVRGLSFSYLAAYSPIKRMDWSVPVGAIMLVLIAMSLADSFGYFVFYTGIDSGLVSIIAPLAAFSPLFAAIESNVFYKERLFLNQKIGILISVIGLTMLAVV
jgi:uncharacterized membrane protein